MHPVWCMDQCAPRKYVAILNGQMSMEFTGRESSYLVSSAVYFLSPKDSELQKEFSADDVKHPRTKVRGVLLGETS